MRQKQIYKDSEITTDLYTWGAEWQTEEDGVEYKGLYHKYTTGEIYTQPVWDRLTSKKLVKYQIPDIPIIALYKTLHKNKIQTNYKQPISVLPIVSDTDKTNGYFYRYFIKKNNEDIIIEIDKTQYTEWQDQLIDPNLYTAVKVKWQIDGWRSDAQINNENVVKLNNSTLPGLSIKLIKFDEFYVTDPSLILIPADINKSSTPPVSISGNSTTIGNGNTGTGDGNTGTVTQIITTPTNKTILDETGKLASDALAKIIINSAFVDVDIKSYTYLTETDFKRQDIIIPVTKYIRGGVIIENPYLNQSGYMFIDNSNIISLDTNDIAYQDTTGIFEAAGFIAKISPIPVLSATKTGTMTIKGINIGKPTTVSITVGKGPVIGPGPTPPAPPPPPPDDPTKTGEGVSQLTAD